jgi:hypothetical protein
MCAQARFSAMTHVGRNMPTNRDNEADDAMSNGSESPRESPQADERPSVEEKSGHGMSGEGSRTALARLISQEQSRIVPGQPDDAPTGST